MNLLRGKSYGPKCLREVIANLSFNLLYSLLFQSAFGTCRILKWPGARLEFTAGEEAFKQEVKHKPTNSSYNWLCAEHQCPLKRLDSVAILIPSILTFLPSHWHVSFETSVNFHPNVLINSCRASLLLAASVHLNGLNEWVICGGWCCTIIWGQGGVLILLTQPYWGPDWN